MALLFGGGGGVTGPSPGAATLGDRSDSVATLPGSLQSLPHGPPWRHKLKKRLKRLYRKLGLNHLLPLLVVMVFTLVGGGLFLGLEGSADAARRREAFEDYLEKRRELEERIREISQAEFLEDAAKARTIAEAVSWFERGIGFSASPDSVWNFWSACYFSGTLYTTIGYGNIACVTAGGRVATMLYSLVGIPLVLTALNDLGKWLFKAIQYAMERSGALRGWLLLQLRLQQARRRQAQARKGVKALVVHLEVPGSDQPVLIPIEQDPDDIGAPPGQPSDDGSASEESEDLAEELLEEAATVPKIPVSVALGVTVGWIFLIAAFFLLWEKEWSYGESVYFFFISLSTIGLGDVVPAHPEYMVMNFLFVIVGLSLVSMSINVVQQKLEELYLQLLLMVLKQYHHQMASGDGNVNATMGMMQQWQNSPQARFLMPLLSGSKKQSVMAEFHKEAKAQGIPVPAILSSLDTETGLPAIFKVEADEAASPPLPLAAVIEAAVAEAQEEAQEDVAADPPPPPALYVYETDTQTDTPLFQDSPAQTTAVDTIEEFAQTSWSQVRFIEDWSQTTSLEASESEAQTSVAEVAASESQTDSVSTDDSATQSHILEVREQAVQSHLYDLAISETQTDLAETANKRLQTAHAEFQDQEAQTDPVNIGQPKAKGAGIRKRFRRAFGSGGRGERREKRNSEPGLSTDQPPDYGDDDEEEDVEDEEGEEGEEKEVLDWDPIDGKHAEKQKSVSHLKAMFDQSKKKK